MSPTALLETLRAGSSAEPSAGDPPPARRDRSASWVPVGLALFTVAWGGNQFTPLLVMYQETGGFSLAVVDVLLGAYVLGIVPGMLVGGPLSDRWGRRPLMLAAPPAAVLGSVVLAAGGDSAVALFAGRVLSGLALGIAMAVGSTWIQELSRRAGPAGSSGGASRSALSLTTGFLLGPAAAGTLAHWGPWPTVLPYVAHAALTIPLGLLALGTLETRPRVRDAGRLRDDLRVPVRGHRRFWTVVAPVAPWVFGCAGSAYAVLPTLVAARIPGAGVLFAAAMTVLTLLFGVGAQSVARRTGLVGARGGVLALVVAVAGMLLAGLAAAELTLTLAAVAAAVLGVAYGLALVSGLAEVARLAAPEHLAGLTAVFYGLAYTGFLMPAVLAVASVWVPYPVLFGVGAVAALTCLAVVLRGRRLLDPAVD